MKISVINATQLEYQEVQNVLRAVNRQLREDFKMYWDKDVELCLEGWAGETPDPNRPFDIRGDAVLYLWDQEDVSGALGYHALTNSGLPFGFVFTRLSDALGEPWSVTLSHEALELAVDPEINLLSQGPHPDPSEGGRKVYHWYELCDAVQGQTYKIDEVEVSNFVLPLYFTENEEHINHNDFLGLGVKSFGVSPGGYVGFFDPLTSQHEQYVADEDAERRRELKAEYQESGRTNRRDGNNQINNTRKVYCEAITIEAVNEKSRTAAMTHARSFFNSDWKLTYCDFEPLEIDAVYRGKSRLKFSSAWQLAHELETADIIAWAEPSFIAPYVGETDLPDDDLMAIRKSSISGDSHKPGTDNNFWALEQCRVHEAWDLVAAKDQQPGQGVVIGHPDSGFLQHREMDISRVRLGLDRDFLENDDDAETDKVKHGSHGLATASVIMSGKNNIDDGVYGPATAATIVPLRVTKPGLVRPTPVLLSGGMRRLRDAIYYASNIGCQVISMSLGGLPNRSLHKAVKAATGNGVIVLAAAGNKVGFVVWPAKYPETIAVAGSNILKQPWSGSSRGSTVDITAPAESVWRASFDKNAEVVGRGNGTSYAVALTAGAAAMWRAYHSEALSTVAPEQIPELFRASLKQSASTDHELEPGKFGAGLLDCKSLLEIPLKDLSIQPVISPDTHMRLFFEEDIKAKVPEISESLALELICAKTLTDFLAAEEESNIRNQFKNIADVPSLSSYSPMLRIALEGIE